MARKIIISCAITGGIHTPTMSPYLPITPDQIADSAIEAAEAGAAAVHIHVRRPDDGLPVPDQELFGTVVEKIKAKSEAIICTTTGGSANQTVEDRVAVVQNLRPELASFNMGSMNFALFPAADKYQDWRYDWEEQYLVASQDYIFRNTFGDMEKICRLMDEAGTKPELEIYDLGQLNNAAFLVRRGLIKPPLYIQFVQGILGGMPATLESLVFIKGMADRFLGPENYRFSAFGAGRMEYPICTTAVLLGGHCRVGLEDNLYLAQGVMAKSNAELVEKMVRILKEFSLEPASPDEAREMLGLKK